MPRSLATAKTSTSRPVRLVVPESAGEGPVAKAEVVPLVTPSGRKDRSVLEQRDRVVLADDVLFAFGKATLGQGAHARIAATAQVLRQRADGAVRVDGYTDSVGSTASNDRLSARRAAAVRAALDRELARDGGAVGELVAQGRGEADPVAPNRLKGQDYPTGRALNRRVEVVYHQKPDAGGSTPATSASASPAPPGSGGGPGFGLPVSDRVVARSTVAIQRGVRVPVEVYRLYRHDGVVTLEFGARTPVGQGRFGPGTMFGRGLFETDTRGVYLDDDSHDRRYLPASFGRECLCTWTLGRDTVAQGQVFYETTTYAAPPPGTRRMTVQVPGIHLVLKDVPVEG